MAKANNVEEYIKAHPKWQEQLKILRNFLNAFPLTETIKWGIPVYTMDGKNLVGLAAFKNHFSLWFYQGAILKRNTALFQNAQEGKTQALRQIKFFENTELDIEILKNYIKETIEYHEGGKKVVFEATKKLSLPEELEAELKKDKDLRTHFNELSPGKQREYAAYISEAKREETKQKRLKKIIPLISAGKGLNDKYKS